MSDLAQALVTWEEFLALPDRDDAVHYELHDGEVVEVPPRRLEHVWIQTRLQRLMERPHGEPISEFPYRPQTEMQFWQADIAFVPHEDETGALESGEYVPYAPPLIVEILSPSNRPGKVNRQRVVAMSAGTLEFWVVDPVSQTVQITTKSGVSTYCSGEVINSGVLGGNTLVVEKIFARRQPS